MTGQFEDFLIFDFRGFRDLWFSIIHNKSISYPKITNFISINSIFSLVSKYIILIIFWHLLILWFYRTPTVGQSQCFDFDFWLFSIESEILILKISYLVYLYYFHSLHLIFISLKPRLNLSLTKLTLQLKSTLLCGSTRYLHITWFSILSLWVRFYKFCLTYVYVF